jgi:hypothetical protein
MRYKGDQNVLVKVQTFKMKRAFLSLQLLVLTTLAVRGQQGGAGIACRLLQTALPGSVFFPGLSLMFVSSCDSAN